MATIIVELGSSTWLARSNPSFRSRCDYSEDQPFWSTAASKRDAGELLDWRIIAESLSEWRIGLGARPTSYSGFGNDAGRRSLGSTLRARFKRHLKPAGLRNRAVITLMVDSFVRNGVAVSVQEDRDENHNAGTGAPITTASAIRGFKIACQV